MLIQLDLVLRVPRYDSTLLLVFLDSLGIEHMSLVGVGLYPIDTMGCCCRSSFPVDYGFNVESTCVMFCFSFCFVCVMFNNE